MIINVFVDFWELGEVWQGRDSLIYFQYGEIRYEIFIQGVASFCMKLKFLLRTALPVVLRALVVQGQILCFRGVVRFCMKSLLRTALLVDSGSGCSAARFPYSGRG
jgi:hypothetical protein